MNSVLEPLERSDLVMSHTEQTAAGTAARPGFAGKVAIVTGGGSGIGAAVCRRLAAAGAQVVVLDIDEAAAKTVADDMQRGLAKVVDVSDPAQVDLAVAETLRDFGALDVVVHAAGIDDPIAKQRIAEGLVRGQAPEVTAALDDLTWRRVLSVNLDGTFHVLRAAVRAMLPFGGGAIVAIGSSAAFDAPLGYPHYSAAKAGVHALAQSVAKEVIGRGIRVNVVAPGPTDTGMATRTPEPLRQAFSGAAVRPYATPEEIADIVMFLASDEASNVVGGVVLANGGRFTA
jgi:NAD(P)-dependent dehydrogenase (short-subunit alcohol dehydrogenase family)